MEDPKVTYSDERRKQADAFLEIQSQTVDGELTRGFYVTTEVEKDQSKICGIGCGPSEQRLTHTINSFAKPTPVTGGKMKLNSADELIGKPIIKQRLNQVISSKNSSSALTNKFLSFGVASTRNFDLSPQTQRSMYSNPQPTNRSYTYLSNANSKMITSNTGIPHVSRVISGSFPVVNTLSSLISGFCSCPGFISVCNNRKVQTIEQEQIPSDSDFAESDSEDGDEGLDVAQEEQA
ncbi:hypothetical protein HWI79_1348 [Cryptosporidium felis]|nr:hypothetical protein HWI79_1348 [Cryptosporidium felis]